MKPKYIQLVDLKIWLISHCIESAYVHLSILHEKK